MTLTCSTAMARIESYKPHFNEKKTGGKPKLQEEFIKKFIFGEFANVSMQVSSSERTIRRSSRRSSMKMMVGVYRSRFQTIDYFMMSGKCRISHIYKFLYKITAFSQRKPYFLHVFFMSPVYIFRHYDFGLYFR